MDTLAPVIKGTRVAYHQDGRGERAGKVIDVDDDGIATIQWDDPVDDTFAGTCRVNANLIALSSGGWRSLDREHPLVRPARTPHRQAWDTIRGRLRARPVEQAVYAAIAEHTEHTITRGTIYSGTCLADLVELTGLPDDVIGQTCAELTAKGFLYSERKGTGVMVGAASEGWLVWRLPGW